MDRGGEVWTVGMPAESSLRFIQGSFRLPGFGPDAKDAISRIMSLDLC
jgi:hypothetical protein